MSKSVIPNRHFWQSIQHIFLIVGLILLFVIFLNSCKLNTEYNIESYRKQTNFAEKEIINGNYSKALESYNKSIKYIKTPLGIDCFNALICSSNNKNWGDSLFWISKLIEKGCELSLFKQPYFKELRATNEWKNYVENEFQKNRDQFNKTKEPNLIKSLKEIIERDQIIYKKIPVGLLTSKEAFQKTKDIDLEIISLIEKYGFPTEEKVGLSIVNNEISSGLFFGILIRHSFQSDSKIFYKEVLDEANAGFIKKEHLDLLAPSDLYSENAIIKFKDHFYYRINGNEDFFNWEIQKSDFILCRNNKKFLLTSTHQEIGNFKSLEDQNDFLAFFSNSFKISCQ